MKLKIKFEIKFLRASVSQKPNEKFPDLMTRIREKYKSEVREIADWAEVVQNISDFCADPSNFRFSWLDKFIC